MNTNIKKMDTKFFANTFWEYTTNRRDLIIGIIILICLALIVYYYIVSYSNFNKLTSNQKSAISSSICGIIIIGLISIIPIIFTILAAKKNKKIKVVN